MSSFLVTPAATELGMGIVDQGPYLSRVKQSGARVRNALQAMTSGLREKRAIAPPSLLFSQSTRLLIRTNELQILFERLLDNRQILLEIDLQRAQTPIVIGQRVERWEEERRCSDELRLDFEPLYLFGNIALDLLSCVAAHVLGVPRPSSVTFDTMRRWSEKSNDTESIEEILEPLRVDILWLAYVLRFHRNRFVTHIGQPWQIGSGCTGRYGFHLSSSRSPHLALARSDEEEIDRLAKAAGFRMINGTPGLVLFELTMRIGHIADGRVRKRIADLHDVYGTITPTFHVVGDRLLGFLADAAERIRDIAMAKTERVCPGSPGSS